jgi:hypothetical protein
MATTATMAVSTATAVAIRARGVAVRAMAVAIRAMAVGITVIKVITETRATTARSANLRPWPSALCDEPARSA